MIVLTRRLLVTLASAVALGGCATAPVINDDALSKEAPASPPPPPPLPGPPATSVRRSRTGSGQGVRDRPKGMSRPLEAAHSGSGLPAEPRVAQNYRVELSVKR